MKWNTAKDEIVKGYVSVGTKRLGKRTMMALKEQLPDHTEGSIRSRFKKHVKELDAYNLNHRELKYKINDDFMADLQSKSVLDCFAGGCFYQKYVSSGVEVFNNELNPQYYPGSVRTYNATMDANKVLSMAFFEGKKYDIVDIDPFNSPMEYLDLALRVAKKGLILTFGDFALLANPSNPINIESYINRTYGIQSKQDFTIDNVLKEVQRVAGRFGKKLEVYKTQKLTNIYRVWLTIDEITSAESSPSMESYYRMVNDGDTIDMSPPKFKAILRQLTRELSLTPKQINASLFDSLSLSSYLSLFDMNPANALDYCFPEFRYLNEEGV